MARRLYDYPTVFSMECVLRLMYGHHTFSPVVHPSIPPTANPPTTDKNHAYLLPQPPPPLIDCLPSHLPTVWCHHRTLIFALRLSLLHSLFWCRGGAGWRLTKLGVFGSLPGQPHPVYGPFVKGSPRWPVPQARWVSSLTSPADSPNVLVVLVVGAGSQQRFTISIFFFLGTVVDFHFFWPDGKVVCLSRAARGHGRHDME